MQLACSYLLPPLQFRKIQDLHFGIHKVKFYLQFCGATVVQFDVAT